jgi:hypothetical protein
LLAAGASSARPIVAVVSFKGSTANMQDWKANFKNIKAASSPLCAGSDACVHPGWLGFLRAIIDALEGYDVSLLPEAVRTSWGLPAESQMSVWELLQSAFCEQVLCVGHSLGGALAALAATLLGLAAVDAHHGTRAPHPPMLVSFGSPVVGNGAFVGLQNRVVALGGGLRLFNRLDPVPSMGHGMLSLAHALGGESARRRAHGGLPVELKNGVAISANPLLNHLTYVLDSYECFADAPCARAKYVLPGIWYSPDRDTAPIASTGLSAQAAAESNADTAAAAPAGAAPTWRQSSGRRDGSEGYTFGDFSRSAARWFRDLSRGPPSETTPVAHKLQAHQEEQHPRVINDHQRVAGATNAAVVLRIRELEQSCVLTIEPITRDRENLSRAL